MNRKAIWHIADSNFCYAIDEKTVELLLRVDSSDRFDEVNVIYGNKYDYYLKQITKPMSVRFIDKSYNYYFIRLPLDDVRLVYIFELKSGEEHIYFCEDGAVDTYDFTLAYFNSFQLPYINKIDVVQNVEWLNNAVFYQIFVDRFDIGDTNKDLSYVNLHWGDIPTPKSFAGGDLKGITNRLEYLKELGVNALYLTPIFKSKSNHKYDICDYYNVDDHFGGNSSFKELVEKAHSLGIRVVLDGVFNHCSEDLLQFQDVVKNGKSSKYYNWFIINGDKVDRKRGNYEYFGVCKYMPKLNTSSFELQDFLIDVALHWIKEYDIDGWRLDVSDEVSHDFWRKLRSEVKGIKSDAILLGENWHDAYPYLRGDEYDGIMNYALTKALMDYYVNNSLSSEGLAQRLSALYIRNKRGINHMMLNLLDSHDTHRFYTLVGKNMDKLISSLAIVFCHCGSTCIYYGTELPLEGGHDPDSRRTMDWSKSETIVKTFIKALAKIKEREELKKGEIYYRYDGDAFIMNRVTDNRCIRLIVTNGKGYSLDNNGILLSHNYADGRIDGIGFVIQEVRA